VLACYSEDYFAKALRSASVTSLVTTRALMAPEGYVVDAVLRAMGDNATPGEIRRRTIAAYAKWQRISYGEAARVFASGS
jgi:hypothetical protein